LEPLSVMPTYKQLVLLMIMWLVVFVVKTLTKLREIQPFLEVSMLVNLV